AQHAKTPSGPPPIATQSPIEIHILAHIEAFVIASDGTESLGRAKLDTSLSHSRDPGEQPPTPQVPPDDSPPGSILKLNRAADTPIALDLSSDPEKQGLANRRVSINKCQHIARCSTGASITSLSDTPDRLIDHSSSMTSGNVGCAVRAGVVDNNDL